MTQDLSLHQRRRTPAAAEINGIPWLSALQPHEYERATAALMVGDAMVGDYVCRMGKPVTYWFGVVEGLLKMNSDNAEGDTMTFAGLPPGGWFGEGTVIKREPYRYNVQALRKSVVAGLPIETFHWLLDHSIGFNRFVMHQLNERLGQFIGAREIDRMANPNLRVARSLAALFNPVCIPAWVKCCASRSRNWPTWSGCRASASTKPWPRCMARVPFASNMAACGYWIWLRCAPANFSRRPAESGWRATACRRARSAWRSPRAPPSTTRSGPRPCSTACRSSVSGSH